MDSDIPSGPPSRAALWGTLFGMVVTLPALFLAVLSSGAGHGDYLFARALFPWPMLVTLDQEIGVPALVMALALSAAAIHVQAAFDPSIALDAVRRSLDDELTSTEMSITMCYAVIDTRAGEVRFANAGHPHAFRVGADGQCVRLTAVVPPIGFSDAPIEECVMSWRRGDRLVLFTDGLVEVRGRSLDDSLELLLAPGPDRKSVV